MFTYQGKNDEIHESDPVRRYLKQPDTSAPSYAEHYYPSRSDIKQENPSYIPTVSRTDMLSQRRADSSTPVVPKNPSTVGNNTVIQRYLIIGNTDVTALYYSDIKADPSRAETYLNERITAIAVEMLHELVKRKKSTLDEKAASYIDYLIHRIVNDEDGLLRKQAAKWLRDDVGEPSSHSRFGHKYQPRAYQNYYDLAAALVGWVDAKENRSIEKIFAHGIMEDSAINDHLDSVFFRIVDFILRHSMMTTVYTEIQSGQPIKTDDHKGKPLPQPAYWALYRSFFAQSQDKGSQLPNHWAVLTNPNKYDIRQKTGVLHDLMHYFLEKFGDNFLFKDVPDFTATTLSGRKPYERPDNSQIRGDTKAAKAGKAALDLTVKPKDQKPDVIYSNEEQDPTYQYARRHKLPMYGRHSYSAARMMGLAKQTGAPKEEISAVGWAIMAYWRLHYDHTSIPYHTAHEIMDFTPAFGLEYDPEDRFAGLRNICSENFLNFLTEKAASEPQAFKALYAYYGNDFDCVSYLLKNEILWKNNHIKKYLLATLPSIENFTRLSAELLYKVYTSDTTALSHLYNLDSEKQNHVLGDKPLPLPPIIIPQASHANPFL